MSEPEGRTADSSLCFTAAIRDKLLEKPKKFSGSLLKHLDCVHHNTGLTLWRKHERKRDRSRGAPMASFLASRAPPTDSMCLKAWLSAWAQVMLEPASASWQPIFAKLCSRIRQQDSKSGNQTNYEITQPWLVHWA